MMTTASVIMMMAFVCVQADSMADTALFEKDSWGDAENRQTLRLGLQQVAAVSSLWSQHCEYSFACWCFKNQHH
jgi:hypothetical protein